MQREAVILEVLANALPGGAPEEQLGHRARVDDQHQR
jgi:hypothetical protein